ncbi:MAG TPA: L-seryl-tRNA(Sec) selenium transferase [Candidatus Eisenbacteria bacterium]|nr:L-seryl-tRNA(Sec) selenium transferase [Candidatus Eisenbacteria bacterium]
MSRLRSIPSVESLLQHPDLAALLGRAPRPVIVQAVRDTLAQVRDSMKEGGGAMSAAELAARARALAEASLRPNLRPVINATGIILHTNLGRAPLPEAAVEAVLMAARGYTNLELDLASGSRGSRGAHLTPLLTELLGAPAAIAVNNNAAAMLLALNTLAAGREAVVSRGELVEIGGSFRIPEILERAGATLREVGTTNKTRLRDYERAIGPRTGVVLRVHPSNFAIVGFAERVERDDLVALARKRKVPLLEDVGSGALVDLRPFGLPEEPLLKDALRDGVPLACASGDKLLGGPQAGILAGTRKLVDACRTNPMARALRLDKLSIAALEATLRLYRDPEAIGSAIPTLRMIAEPAPAVRARARRLIAALGADRASRARAEVIPCTAEVGGGSMPLARIPSFAVALSAPGGTIGDLARTLRLGAEPVLARIESGRLLLDLRTVDRRELPRLVAALHHALDGERGIG